MKKCHNIPEIRNTDAVNDSFVTFAHYMYENGLQQHRIYVDETGYNLRVYTSRSYGRAPQGRRVNKIVGG